MYEDRIDLILTGIPKGSGSERFRRENITRKIRNTCKNIYRWIQEGRKSGIRGDHTRGRVQQQSTVFSTEQEAIIPAIWLTEGTQRDKVIITDSLSTLTAINGNNHTKNPKTIKLREMMDRNRKQIALLWVPGHMGIPGNEQADEEAKAAMDDDIQQNEEYPSKDLEKWLKTETTKIRKKR
jgi:ribonuclease HI